MECASLAACAQFRGICFGQILFTADTLADVEDYRERGFGEIPVYAKVNISNSNQCI